MPEIDNLHDIEIFLEAVRTGSFTEAARALGISQPTISHAVKRLERTLGTVLFERQSFGTGGIRLTRSGHIFEAHAERIVEELREARRTIDDLEGRRTIYLGIPPILLSRFYKGAIVTLQRTYHKNKFVVQSLGSSRTLHEISRHALDAGVVACTGSFPTIPNVRARKVGSFPFCFVTPAGHPFLTGRPIEPAALEWLPQFPLVTFTSDYLQRTTLERLFDAYRRDIRIVAEIDQLPLLKALVAAEVGIGFMSTVSLGDNDHEVTMTPIVGTGAPSFNVYAFQDLTRPYYRDDACINAIRELLREPLPRVE